MINEFIKNIDYREVIIFLKDWQDFFLILITFFIVTTIFINYKKRINDLSRKEINKNKNRKYFEDLYVELGNTNELLRYFINKNGWFKKLRSNFYLMFNNNIGEKLSNFKINRYDTKTNTYKNVEYAYSAIKSLDDRKRTLSNIDQYISNNVYWVKRELEDLLLSKRLINSRVSFVIGEAGSGKTNLMTKISDVLINKYKKHCIYINAKTITDNDIERKFNEFFYTKVLINENTMHLIKLYISILAMFKFNIFIIVEAVNENEDSQFMMSLINFINKYSKFNNINFIITSRSEYFDIKYKKCIENHLLCEYQIIKINHNRINEATLNRMFEKYKIHFKYSGHISKSVDLMLKKSPIMMRMFFECFQKTDEDINELTRFKLFNFYITKLNDEYIKINLWELLYNIVECMIKNKKYDFVKYKELSNPDDISNTLIYENVLLDKTIIIDENKITQNVIDVVTFTYDEMRDFVISKYIIAKNINNKNEIFKFLNDCKENNKSILEGIIRYMYYHYIIENDIEMAKTLLYEYNIDNYYNYNDDEFRDFGLEIIFQMYRKLENFEIDYIIKKRFSQNDIHLLIVKLINNSLNSVEPGIQLLINEISKFINDNNYSSNLLMFNKDYYISLLKSLEGLGKNKNLLIDNLINILKKLIDIGEE